MPIEFRCTQCGQMLRVPDDSSGKAARCPKCQALMTVPAAEGAVPLAGGALPSATEPFGGSMPPATPQPPPKPTSDAADAVYGAYAPNLNPYASPAGGYAYGPAGASTPFARPGLPWETKGQSFATWWETSKMCLMQPSYAFSIMRQYGGAGQPMLFCAIGLAIGTFGQMLWYIPLIVMFTALGAQGQANGGEVAAVAGVQVVMQFFSAVFTVAIGATLGLFIGAAIAHVCLMIVGGAKQSYETTLRVLGYAQGSTAWMNVIPCGGLAAFVWLIVLEILGFAQAHETTAGKAALAVFLPFIVCGGCVIILLAIAFGVAFTNAN
jgi:hypothetical protein